MVSPVYLLRLFAIRIVGDECGQRWIPETEGPPTADPPYGIGVVLTAGRPGQRGSRRSLAAKQRLRSTDDVILCRATTLRGLLPNISALVMIFFRLARKRTLKRRSSSPLQKDALLARLGTGLTPFQVLFRQALTKLGLVSILTRLLQLDFQEVAILVNCLTVSIGFGGLDGDRLTADSAE